MNAKTIMIIGALAAYLYFTRKNSANVVPAGGMTAKIIQSVIATPEAPNPSGGYFNL